MRAATITRTSRTPRPTSSRTGQRTRRCILGRQAYVQPAARPHATLRARAPIPVNLVDRRPRANGRATTAAHSAGGKRAVDSRNVRGILRARGDRATSEPARGMWKQQSEHEACIADMSEGRGARGEEGSTYSAARAGSRPIVVHEALVTSAEVSDSMDISRAGIHTCASARGRERRVSLEFLGARGSRVARNGGRVREDGVRMHAIVLQPAGKRGEVCSRGKVVCIFRAAPELEWHAHLRGRRFRRTCSRIGAASGGSAARRRSRWMALRPHPPKKTSRSWTRGRASAHG